MKKDSLFKKILRAQITLPLTILIIFLLVNGIGSNWSFFKITMIDGHYFGRLIDILKNGAPFMLLAIGMTMVLATGGTDISVGSTMAISSALACSIIKGSILPQLEGSFTAAIAIALASGLLCGAWNGFLVTKVKIQPIVATMILLVAGRGIAQLITKGHIATVTSPEYYFINGGYILRLPFPIFIVFFFLGAILLFTKGTAFGLFVESTGVNMVASRVSGIKVDRVKMIVYVFCGLMAAVAGLVESSYIKGADVNSIGNMIELDAILAVAIGGTSLAGGRFSIPSSVVGAIIVQSIRTSLLAWSVPSQAINVAKALIVLVICVLQTHKVRQLTMQVGNAARKRFGVLSRTPDKQKEALPDEKETA